MGDSRKIHRYFPSRLTEGAAMTTMDRQKPIISAARGITGIPPPIMASIFPRSSRRIRAATPMPTSMIRPMQEFQKYMGMPNSRRSSMPSRAFFCPEADWGEEKITGWARSSASTGDHSIYQWIDGVLTEVRHIKIAFEDLWDINSIYASVTDRIEGEMREVSRFEGGSYGDAIEPWFNLWYHGGTYP